jgi:ribosomal 50S subunit-associated protein YjgA (DUF615 family)
MFLDEERAVQYPKKLDMELKSRLQLIGKMFRKQKPWPNVI